MSGELTEVQCVFGDSETVSCAVAIRSEWTACGVIAG